MRRCIVLLLVFFLLPPATGHGDGDGHAEPFQERLLVDAAGPMDLHGTRLAWAEVRDGMVELKVTNLADGSELTVTRIVGEGPQPIQSLAFDGRWVAWTDGRYGNLEAFAIDTETGNLLRLSEHSQDDRDIDVEDGRFAWVRGGVMVSDGTGTAQSVPGSAVSFEPKFAENWLVWSQVQGQRRVLLGQYLADGSVHTLADDEGIIYKDHDAADGHVVWVGAVDKVTRIYTLELHEDGIVGEARVLTGWGSFGSPRTGGGSNAWGGQGTLYVERHSHESIVASPTSAGAMLSKDLLVYVESSGDGRSIVPIQWSEWDATLPPEPRDDRLLIVAAGLVLLMAGAGMQWFRTRRQQGD